MGWSSKLSHARLTKSSGFALALLLLFAGGSVVRDYILSMLLNKKLDSMFVVLGTEVLPARCKLHIASMGWWYICLHEWLISIVSVSKICPTHESLLLGSSRSKLHRWYLHVMWTQVSHEKFETSVTVRTGMSMVLRINGICSPLYK